MGASGPQPGTGPEKHLIGCFHGNITVELEWKASWSGASSGFPAARVHKAGPWGGGQGGEILLYFSLSGYGLRGR